MTRRLRYVHVMVTCPDCEGAGFVREELWDEFFRLYAHDEELSADEKVIRRFWTERGFDEIPSEEKECRECVGLGVCKEWMKPEDFQEALDEAVKAARDERTLAFGIAELLFKKLSPKG